MDGTTARPLGDHLPVVGTPVILHPERQFDRHRLVKKAILMLSIIAILTGSQELGGYHRAVVSWFCMGVGHSARFHPLASSLPGLFQPRIQDPRLSVSAPVLLELKVPQRRARRRRGHQPQ